MYNKEFEEWYESFYKPKTREIFGHKLPDGLAGLLSTHENAHGRLSRSEMRMLCFDYWKDYISSKKKNVRI